MHEIKNVKFGGDPLVVKMTHHGPLNRSTNLANIRLIFMLTL